MIFANEFHKKIYQRNVNQDSIQQNCRIKTLKEKKKSEGCQ